MINPGTEELITKVASAGVEDIDAAVQAAKNAADIWESIPAFVRSNLINKFADKVE